jgi:hypothetical protein
MDCLVLSDKKDRTFYFSAAKSGMVNTTWFETKRVCSACELVFRAHDN